MTGAAAIAAVLGVNVALALSSGTTIEPLSPILKPVNEEKPAVAGPARKARR